MRTQSFAERWSAVRADRTNLVLGVQPSSKWLAAWSLRDDVRGANDFCDILLDRVVPRVAAVKIQTPFFERFGLDGFSLLHRFVARCREQGTLTIADAKRGDADDTMTSLAAAYLGPESWLRADAMTVVAYMGVESIRPIFEAAAVCGSAVFVMVRTSNHASEAVQRAHSEADCTVAQWLGDEITVANEMLASSSPVGPVGAVIGADHDEARDLVRRTTRSLVSLPGLGRPSRTLAELESAAGDAAARALLPITSGVLRDGRGELAANVERWKAAIAGSAFGDTTEQAR